MNQVNPLHIGALLLVLIMFLFFKLSGIKEELVQVKQEYAASKKLAVDVTSLKAVYANKKKTQNAIERILRQSSLKSASFNLKKEKKSIKISSQSMDAKVLNSFMGKILNGSYNITLLKIKKLSDTTASLEMEIQW